MSDRFEFVSKQQIFSGEKLDAGTPYERDEFLLEAVVLRDKQTGVMYLWGNHGNGSGLTPLLDKDGKPMTTFKVNI